MKPFFFQGDQIELIRARHRRIKLILINEIAEPPLGVGTLDQLDEPGFGQFAQFVRRNVADINLVRRVRRRGRKVA